MARAVVNIIVVLKGLSDDRALNNNNGTLASFHAILLCLSLPFPASAGARSGFSHEKENSSIYRAFPQHVTSGLHPVSDSRNVAKFVVQLGIGE